MIVALADDTATSALGGRIAAALSDLGFGQKQSVMIYLAGELGAGKTALVRAVIGALGHAGPVVSPSYTLVEPYAIGGLGVQHLDLYRLGDPEELEYLAVRELDAAGDIVFVEWAERGQGFLPAADIVLTMAYDGAARVAELQAQSAAGKTLVARLAAAS